MALITGYRETGGEHFETAGLHNIIVQKGVVVAETGKPISEQLLFTIGGGVGGGYWLFQFGGNASFVFGVRFRWHQSEIYLQELCDRLGLNPRVTETGSRKAGLAQLTEALNNGNPVVAWLDKASLTYVGLPEKLKKAIVHSVVVCGMGDDDVYLIDDWAQTPWRVPAAEMVEARSVMPYTKHRLLTIDPKGDINRSTLVQAIESGLRTGLADFFAPAISNFGLPAFKKWAELVSNVKSKKGWPAVLTDTPNFLRVMGDAFEAVELCGTTGGALRALHAAGLREAATVLEKSELDTVASDYEDLATRWREFANAALPDDIDECVRIKALHNERRDLFSGKSAGSKTRLAEAFDEVREIEAAANIETDRKSAILKDLETRLLDLHVTEERVAKRLQEAIA